MKKIFINFSLLLLTFSLFLFSYQCSPCKDESVKVLDNLKDDKSIVAFVRGCGATTDYSTNINFYNKTTKKKSDNVFYAYHSSGILIQKISSDTVKVIYTGTDVKKKDKVNGINFIFEYNPKKIPGQGVTIITD